jgi:hypothetical protein
MHAETSKFGEIVGDGGTNGGGVRTDRSHRPSGGWQSPYRHAQAPQRREQDAFALLEKLHYFPRWRCGRHFSLILIPLEFFIYFILNTMGQPTTGENHAALCGSIYR